MRREIIRLSLLARPQQARSGQRDAGAIEIWRGPASATQHAFCAMCRKAM
jgi:hypothetical protein